MLKVKTFKITDDVGMNELLSTYRLAKGAHVFVSEGHLCIPYDDGKPLTKEEKIAILMEQRSEVEANVLTIEVANEHLNAVIDDATERLNTAEADLESAKANRAKQHEMSPLIANRDAKNAMYSSLVAQRERNLYEIMNLVTKVRVIDEKVEELKAE